MTANRSDARARAAAMDWDTLVAMGICECGVALDTHPPLTAPRPLGGRVAPPTPWQISRPPDTDRRRQLREAKRRQRAGL